MFSISSYKNAAIYYLAIIALLFSCFSYYIVAPHRQEADLGLPPSVDTQIENRVFSDFSHFYVPEVSELLRAPRSGWLSLWTKNNELGKPYFHMAGGFSAAWFPSWVIYKFTDDPYRFLTLLALSLCFFAGLFVMLFCREIGLRPVAGLIAGVNLAASPFLMHWLAFPMVLGSLCWSAGALWAVTRLAKRPDLLGWSMLVLSGYSLLITGYPQIVVYHAYLLGGYGLYLACSLRSNRVAVIRFFALNASALTLGVALAFPVYRDLMVQFSESSRVKPDLSFYLAILFKFAGPGDVVRFFVTATVPELFGNPVALNYPFAGLGRGATATNGESVTLITVFFAVIALLAAFRKTWGWWIAILGALLFAFVQPLYVLGIKYLGFNLSRTPALWVIPLPLTVITAFGVDVLARRSHSKHLRSIVLIGGVVTLGIIGIGIALGILKNTPIRWVVVAGMLLVTGLFFAQYDKLRPSLLVLALAFVLTISSYPLMLKQDPAHIAMASPLVEKVRQNLPTDSRFAVAAPGVDVLQPNLNATLGLSSVHSYNSLSSTRYHTLIQALGGQVHTYGRHSHSISPDYDGAMFWMSNISLILSPVQFSHKNLEYLSEESGVHFYHVLSRMGESLQVVPPPRMI